jgi:hypothetical protein
LVKDTINLTSSVADVQRDLSMFKSTLVPNVDILLLKPDVSNGVKKESVERPPEQVACVI